MPDVEKLLKETTLPDQAVLGEFRAVTLQGAEIFVEISISLERGQSPQHSANTAITTLFTRDLTARKQAEAQRLALETQLRKSQKMQAVGTMAGGIAYDFNNILSAILGNVELAKQDTAPGSASRTSLDEIDKAGRRARDLVRQILTFSRNEQPKRIPMYLSEVVQETVRLVRATLPPGVELKVIEASDCSSVLADATQVE